MRKKATPLSERFKLFWDSKGFALLATLCVTVITATAIWTNQSEPPYAVPPLPTPEEHYASLLMQETLADAATPTPLPTTQPPLWSAPLPTTDVLQPYATHMVRSKWSGLWHVHEALDLAADAGSPVKAMAPGKVTALGDDPLYGTWIELTHADGTVTRYACLALGNALKKGDQVRAGQTVGFIGNTGRSEEHLGPHLHLVVTQNGAAVDPLLLIE